MKLSQWAKKLGISYRTAWRMYQKGQIPNAIKLPTGSIIVLEDDCANYKVEMNCGMI
jgi:putative resolvase